MQEGKGGKLLVFLSSLPKTGSKALVVREHVGQTLGTQPLNSMVPATKEYRELAELAANHQVG